MNQFKHNHSFGLWVGLVFLLISTGCGLRPSDSFEDRREQVIISQLDVPLQDYSLASWQSDNRLYLVIDILGDASSNQGFGYVQIDQRPLRFKNLSAQFTDTDGCTIAKYWYASQWPDAKIGLVKSCQRKIQNPGNGPKWRNEESYYMTYDTKTGTLARFVSAPVDIAGVNDADIRDTSMNPMLTDGFAWSVNGMCERAAGFDNKGRKLPHLRVEDGSDSWNLDDDWAVTAHNCVEGKARNSGLPQWSPDGTQIAFTAQPKSLGATSWGRLDTPGVLYLAKASERVGRKVSSSIQNPGSISWSPDSQWLAFVARIGSKDYRLWLYRVSDEKIFLVSDKAVGNLIWSPNGRKIAGVVQGPNVFDDVILIYDVNAIVSIKP